MTSFVWSLPSSAPFPSMTSNARACQVAARPLRSDLPVIVASIALRGAIHVRYGLTRCNWSLGGVPAWRDRAAGRRDGFFASRVPRSEVGGYS